MKSLTPAIIISSIYLILAMVKNKYLNKQNLEQKHSKQIMQESVLVFVSVIIGFFAIDKLDAPVSNQPVPTAFLGKPEF